MNVRCFVFGCVACTLLVSPARPDGAIFNKSGRPLTEREQRAAIFLRDGVQRMILAINYDEDEKQDAIWILPFPSGPEGMEIDILTSFPSYPDKSVKSIALSQISGAMLIARLTQIYPIFCCPLWFGSSKDSAALHQEVNKYGIHGEIVTVESREAFVDHLAQQWPRARETDLSTFAPYCNSRHTFVIVSIQSWEELLKEFESDDLGTRMPCVYVEFSTDEVFFPMRPTSIYGSANIPVQLFIGGYVKPREDSFLADKIDLSYCVGHGVDPDRPALSEFPAAFRAERSSKYRFTRVEISAEAREFTHDLRFVPCEPPGIAYAEFIASHRRYTGAATLVIIVLCSYVSGGIAGWIFARRWSKFAYLGLSNCLTLATLALVVRSRLGDELKNHRFNFVTLFTILFIAFTILIQLALTAPM